MKPYQTTFLDLALKAEVLKFGSFTLKSGRVSPYFFNLGRISSGAALRDLGKAYAEALIAHGVEFDLLFGPAYKGIPLAAAVSIAYAELSGRDLPFAYNRKEAKDHGEGGVLVGADVAGQRVVVVDDVLTAGTALRESHALLSRAGARPVLAITALDRQEVGANGRSAVAELVEKTGFEVVSLVTVQDLLGYLHEQGGRAEVVAAIADYQQRYGVA
ncbi:orotate phosphoribosyltransferase [uncultured Nevskia sp.]|uniref:orotate phosphoribosyltransferase n=1 Tax=uncultured Nevskia sp. TaxID=228950 RepID=UPI0025ED0BDD|nr:orotate phosphoribosyltransferase [uncultured Nevskia sp.]